MKKVKVVVSGLGGVGKRLVKDIAGREGIEIVGVIDISEDMVGKDAGVIAGMEVPIGVAVTHADKKEKEIYDRYDHIDVIINTASSNGARGTYEEMKTAIQHGINVIVANSATTDLWVPMPKLAEEIDAECKKYGVSYFGIGSSHVMERMMVAMTEGSENINKVSFTHYADCHAFPAISNRNTLGIGMTEEEYNATIAKAGGQLGRREFNTKIASVQIVGKYLGWKVDEVKREMKLILDDNKVIQGTHEILSGVVDGETRVEENWIFILDPDRKYYDRIEIEGTPTVDAVVNFSPDRGICTCFGTIRNAIPWAVKAEPGYINSLAVPACTWFADSYENHI